MRKLNAENYLELIDTYFIDNTPLRRFGFDTIAKTLNIDKQLAKDLWNENDLGLKRMTRTEHDLKRRFDLEIKYKSKVPLYELECDEYLSFRLSSTAVLFVPNGMITDLGSVPTWARVVADKDDISMIFAYFFHDIECNLREMSREVSDTLLLEIGEYMGASWTKRNFVFTAVRSAVLGREMFAAILPKHEFSEVDIYNQKLVAQAIDKFYNKTNTVNDFINYKI